MRALPHAALCLLLVIAGFDALAQNPPAANAKPAEQKPSAATTDAKKPAEEKKSVDTKTTAAKPDAKAGAKTDTKTDPKAEAKADSKGASGKDSKADPKTADNVTSSANDKDPRKNAKADGPPCVVAEFRSLGIDVHDPVKRRTQAMSWLKKRAKNCSVDQLLMIRNNRSQWMGTADSATMAAEVDALLEVFAADNPQVAALLYGTVPPPAEGK
jgi:hypothetical protein